MPKNNEGTVTSLRVFQAQAEGINKAGCFTSKSYSGETQADQKFLKVINWSEEAWKLFHIHQFSQKSLQP